MKRKTILHIAEAFGGGIVTFIANLANEQCKGNYRVIVAHGIRKETHANYPDFFDDRIELIKIENFQQEINLVSEWKAICELRNIIKDTKPDVIHMHSSQSGVLGKLASIGCSAYKIYSPHGFAFLRQDVASWKLQIFKAIEKIFSTCFKCQLVASSTTEYKEALKISKKAVLVFNGINTQQLDSYFNVESSNERPVVGMVGRALPQKNPAFFNRIAEKMPHVQFEWIGDGDLRYQLTAPNIHIVGWGPREEALEYVAKSDIYIMTSLWEGMPLALLEAMYLKKPCVVTNVVGNRDVIINGENGYICNTEDEFVEKIQLLVNTPKLSSYFGEMAHQAVVEKYNSEAMAKQYEKLFIKTFKNRC